MFSYEGKMLKDLDMPPRKEVEAALLSSLRHRNNIFYEFQRVGYEKRYSNLSTNG